MSQIAKLALKKWNCFRIILQRQVLLNGNIAAETH